MRYFRIIMGAFCIIVGVKGVLIGSIAIEASHINIIRGAYCITSAGHINNKRFQYTIVSILHNSMCKLYYNKW